MFHPLPEDFLGGNSNFLSVIFTSEEVKIFGFENERDRALILDLFQELTIE